MSRLSRPVATELNLPLPPTELLKRILPARLAEAIVCSIVELERRAV